MALEGIQEVHQSLSCGGSRRNSGSIKVSPVVALEVIQEVQSKSLLWWL